MKNKFTLLLFLCSSFLVKAQVYNGNLDLRTQTQIDTFNYTEINGDLVILVENPANGCTDCITNFNHMSMLTKINGRFQVSNLIPNHVIDLQGFGNVTYIKHLEAGTANNLKFTGLNSIDRIDEFGDFYGSFPPTLSFKGLESLKSIGSLGFSNFPGSDSFNMEGLNNVEIIENFSTHRSGRFNAKGLDNLKEITGTFYVYGDVDFRGMNKINHINYLGVILTNSNNIDTVTFRGIETLNRIDSLQITVTNNSASFLDLQALNGVTSMQQFLMGACEIPLKLDFLTNITALKEINISASSQKNLNELRNINLITGNLTLRDNYFLANCCAIKDLLANGNVHGTIDIRDNGYSANNFKCNNIDSIFTGTCNIHSDSINLIEAKFYIDNNNNNIFDNNDFVIPDKNITLTYPSTNTYTNITDNQGKAKFYVLRGNFQFAVSSGFPPYYTIAPSSVSKTFTTLSNLDSIQFIAHPTSIFNDVSVETVIGGITRVGRENNLLIHIANIGTQTSNGIFKLKMDDNVTVISVSPLNISTSGDTLVWNIANLLPLNNKDIYVQYKPYFNLFRGDTLYHYATFVNNTTDATPVNNSFVAPDSIRGSYDPNDKSVNNPFITPGAVASGNYLTYTIRFQNTGNDTAFRVEIKDTLSNNLDWNSIEMIGASHPYTFKQENGKYITFTFNNILLPDSNVNEIKSHGFVSFKIKPKTTLPLGADIKNTGYIYFDLNAPVKTNTVQTTVQLLANTISNPKFDGKISMFPNPNNGAFNLKIDAKQTGNMLVTITNITGQMVYTTKVYHDGHSLLDLNSNDWEAGTYLVTIQLNNETTSQKLLIVK